MQKATQAQIALDAIRRTICIAGHEGETVLYETELAKQYGMSRTPIRQILQRLAYDRLVFTKSGVGTVVTPLNEEDRTRDFLSLAGLTAAIEMHDLPELSVSQHSDVLALDGFANALAPEDAEMHYELLSRLHGLLTELVPDPVLQDAFSACFWRATRWFLRARAQNPEATNHELKSLVSALAGYEGRAARNLFERLREGIAS